MYEEQFCVQPTEGGVTHSTNVKVQRGRRPANVHNKLLVPPYGYVHGSPSGNTSATSATKSAERPVESNNASPLESGNVSKLESAVRGNSRMDSANARPMKSAARGKVKPDERIAQRMLLRQFVRPSRDDAHLMRVSIISPHSRWWEHYILPNSLRNINS